eukprot:GSMAST32.ASY1.ANO1.671.1 assembled CDS
MATSAMQPPLGMSMPNASQNAPGNVQTGADYLAPLVLQLTNPEQRESALLDLSKKQIVSIYPMLSPPSLNAHASNRSRPFEYLRLTSLGVIGALVKVDDSEVISFLLQTEIIPLCLRIMESGSELSKTVATFIVQKILLDDTGLGYICVTAERFYAVSTVLSNMVSTEARQEKGPSGRLVKHIVRCYLRISDNPPVLSNDAATIRWLTQLRSNIAASASTGETAIGAVPGGAPPGQQQQIQNDQKNI